MSQKPKSLQLANESQTFILVRHLGNRCAGPFQAKPLQSMRAIAVKQRTVIVNDRMQQGYRYILVAPIGRNFDPDFRPELSPQKMLRLGVFGGKYMTDCKDEFPRSWFTRAGLSPKHTDTSLNCFGVNASQSLSVWRRKGWIIRMIRAAGSNGTAVIIWVDGFGRRSATDQTLESDAKARAPSPNELRTRRYLLPEKSTASATALGLRQPQALTPIQR